MNDQAEGLRSMLANQRNDKSAKTLAVMSGKGGVGKSNISLNFSLALLRKGFKVLLFDMDIGMGNIDILMGKSSEYSIADFFAGRVSLKDMIVNGPSGLHYIAGGTGLGQLVKVEDLYLEKFMVELSELFRQYDYVLFDMGAGITTESAKFILSVQELIVVTTPEPTSIMDAYTAMKHVHLSDASIPFYLVINRVQNGKEGQETYQRISNVLKKFLGRDSYLLGQLPDDNVVSQAVKRQIPFLLMNEKSQVSKAIFEITERYVARHFQDQSISKTFPFVTKLRRFLFER